MPSDSDKEILTRVYTRQMNEWDQLEQRLNEHSQNIQRILDNLHNQLGEVQGKKADLRMLARKDGIEL